MNKVWFRILTLAGIFGLWSGSLCAGAGLSDSNAAPEIALTNSTVKAVADAGTNSSVQSDSNETLRAYLQLQGQIHETLLAIERNRQDSEEAAARNARAVAARLQLIEQRLDAQRARDVEAAQRTNRTLILVVSAFAAFGCLAVVLTAYFQWRAVNRFTAIAGSFPAGRGLGSFPSLAALAAGENNVPAIESSPQTEARLLGAIERLEKRIQELEQTSHPPLNGADTTKIVDLPSAEEDVAVAPSEERPVEEHTPQSSLLGKGQTLLNLGKVEEAIACFDEVLAADPGNAEALVKKGTALERLRKTQEALECYDRAIASDGSLTIAYLYKGGLCNRMERFGEALECYEQALHAQEKRRAL